MSYMYDAARQRNVLGSIVVFELAYLLVEVDGGYVSIANGGLSLPYRHVELVGGNSGRKQW
jgi:hypothetical protein